MVIRHLVLVGFGNVARRFVRLTAELRGRLAGQEGLVVRIVGIATRRHGLVFDPGGLDGLRACAVVEAGDALTPATLGSDAAVTCADVFDLVARAGASIPAGTGVLLETTPLDVEQGEPAASHLQAAFGAGLDAITANKGPIACAFAELSQRAAATRRTLRFEGTVMDGVPIFNLARETLRGAEITRVRGVVNSTTNYILTEMERDVPYAEALARMQAQGIAEADPTLDVEGWDAAAKIAALANVMLGARMRPADVERQGITSLTPADLRAAIARDERVRLVATASRDGTTARARVQLERLPAGELLAQLAGMANALIIETDVLGEVAIVQRDGGLTQTAYALLSDLLSLPALVPGQP